MLGTPKSDLRFNPLTGISSILTNARGRCLAHLLLEFQSPDGDFVYSDKVDLRSKSTVAGPFQSPDGDFVYSDLGRGTHTRRLHYEFQSPDGDFVYSDLFGKGCKP